VTRFDISVLPEAEEEIREAFRWYAERSPLAARAFRSTVIETLDAPAEDADRWPLDDQGIHRVVLRRFPYTVWYDLQAQAVTVLAVAHHHRRPGYWKPRGA